MRPLRSRSESEFGLDGGTVSKTASSQEDPTDRARVAEFGPTSESAKSAQRAEEAAMESVRQEQSAKIIVHQTSESLPKPSPRTTDEGVASLSSRRSSNLQYITSDFSKYDDAAESPNEDDGGAISREETRRYEVEEDERGNGIYRSGSAGTGGKEFLEIDPDLVTWDGDNDPENPLNWSRLKKFVATAIVALITLTPGITSSMSSPATADILKYYNNGNETVGRMITSIMLITWGFSGAIMAPISEMVGRKYVFVVGAAGAAAFDFGCAYAPNMAALLVFRALSGVFNVPPLVIGAGCMADLFEPHERLWPLAWWALGPSMGPVLGPILGAFITQWSIWRWTFLTSAIVQASFGALLLVFMKESYAPVLLGRKCARLRKETGNKNLHTIWEVTSEPLLTKAKNTVIRPILFLTTNPIVFGLGLFIAFVYALMFLVLTTYFSMWMEYYNYQVFVGGLMYIGLAVGMVIGEFGWTYLMNRRIVSQKKKGKGVPEDYLFYLPLAGIQMCIGIFWYGWSAQGRVHWMMEQIGMALFGAGICLMFQTIQPYIVLLNPRFAGSAIAALVIFRCELSCAFPLFGQAMYNKLGYGWANTLIGLLVLVIGVPFPFLVIRNGERMRNWANAHCLVRDDVK